MNWFINSQFNTMCSINIFSYNTFHRGVNENITMILIFSQSFFFYFTRTISTIWDHFFKCFHTIFFFNT